MLINKIIKFSFKNYANKIDEIKRNPISIQKTILNNNIKLSINTLYGKKYNFNKIKSINDFQNNVPIVTYEEFEPYIKLIKNGKKNITWPNKPIYLAKSSGTTNDRSKFIPITKDSLYKCHFTGGKMLLAQYLNLNPNTNIFKYQNLKIGGSSTINKLCKISYGDLSAIIIKKMPALLEYKTCPNKKIALIGDWIKKTKKIIDECLNKNISSISGVPSWILIILNEILQKKKIQYIDELWPNIEVFFHGGISFDPYVENFKCLFRKTINYIEIYNASEGFFAIQDKINSKELLLLLNNGIFYEFIQLKDYRNKKLKYITLEEVNLNIEYVIVITTNGGLWRYIIGDTIKFTSKNPYRIIISGRTKHFINTFGEELIIDNCEKAIKLTCKETNSIVKEYTVAPKFMENNKKGSHEWIIEFSKFPNNFKNFEILLDKNIKKLNSDYAAKRSKNFTLLPPILHIARPNLFFKWMRIKNKLGGQNKVPRLSNNRKYIEELLKLNSI